MFNSTKTKAHVDSDAGLYVAFWFKEPGNPVKNQGSDLATTVSQHVSTLGMEPRSQW